MSEQHLGHPVSVILEIPLILPDQMTLPDGGGRLLLWHAFRHLREAQLADAGGNGS